jgi:hypothetical protein
MLNRIVLGLVLAAGCGTSIQATMINPAPHPMQSRPPESVEVYSSGPPQRPYIDVAYLEAEQQTAYSVDDTAQFIGHLRERAAAMGCDGVVLGGVTHAAEPTSDLHLTRKGLTATCVMFLPETMAATPPAPAAPPPAPPAPPPVAAPGTR